MKTRRTTLSAIAFTLLLFGLNQAQNESQEKALPNFHQVNANLYRGGQPKPEGIAQLKRMGIKTIVNLRDNDARAISEKSAAEAAGLRYFNLPLPTFNRPSDDAVKEALSLINAPDNQPVFVHCHRGSDRTGTVIAIYRIEHDGWTSDQARTEAKQYGLGMWQMSMKDYINDYYERRPRPSADAQIGKPFVQKNQY
jgi:tyrosine-protein phosphatase SIW14